MNSLKDLMKKNCVLQKKDGHINIEDYLTCEKIWNKFK